MLNISSLLRVLFSLLIIFLVLSNSIEAQSSEVDYSKVVHTFNEAWNTGNYDLLDLTVHPEYFKKEGDQEIVGIEPLKEYVKNFRKSLPDARITYIEEVYGDRKAAIRFTLEGTPIDTGKKYKAEGIVIFHFADGKIISDRSVFDQLTALQQQGYKLVPPSEE